ncbi:MAG: triose-phosphate isomerase [Gammaproteobacteria bacterium]
MRRPLVAGNWKMNGTRAEACTLVRAVAAALDGDGDGGVDVALCPPFVLLDLVAELLGGSSRVMLGAQNVATETAGAFTGEVTAEMLLESGCRLVLVGHSERRQYYGETDEVVAAKAARAMEAGLTPVICFGESFAERESGATESVVARQLDAVIDNCGACALADSVLAYEPVWAIGTGLTATPAEANAVHEFLRTRVAQKDPQVAGGLRILYGGSVKSANASKLFAMPDIDGGLIGGASLVADEFIEICRKAA